MTLRSSFVGFLVKYEQHIQHMSYIPTMLELFCIVGLLLWSCEEVLNVEVLIIVLCLSSLSNWLVGFCFGDSHCFMFVFFCFWFCNLYFVFFFFVFFCFWFFGLFFLLVFVLFFFLFFFFIFLVISSHCFVLPVINLNIATDLEKKDGTPLSDEAANRYRRILGRIAWWAQTRVDHARFISMLSVCWTGYSFRIS